MAKTLNTDNVNIYCGTCFHQWKNEDCSICQKCDTFSSYRVDTVRCEYCENMSFRTILCDSCGKWHPGDNTEWGFCLRGGSRTNCKSTCKDFELVRHYRKFDPLEDARCSFDKIDNASNQGLGG